MENSEWLYSIKRLSRRFFVKKPWVYDSLAYFRGIDRSSLVSKSTEVLITGAGGCANTFAVKAFKYAQTEPVEIAHHLHVPAQVIKAVKLSVPTLVLIRDPIAAAISLFSRGHIEFNQRAIEYVFSNYSLFYDTIVSYSYGFVVATFEEIVSDYSNPLLRLNNQFNRSFGIFKNNKEDVDKCFGTIRLAKPDSSRVIEKNIIQNELLSSKHTKKVERVYDSYNNFMIKTTTID